MNGIGTANDSFFLEVQGTLKKPHGLNEDAWKAICSHARRLANAIERDDRSLRVGSSKELVEAVARVVIEHTGGTSGSNEGLSSLVSQAHTAIDRAPGRGVAANPAIRNLAQAAKNLAVNLAELRNIYGTGHGRTTEPEIDIEMAEICSDAALVWSRWALNRLGYVIASSSLIEDLYSSIFTRGVLADRLRRANIRDLPSVEQRRLGIAVGQRAASGTFLVRIEGAEACAEDSDLSTWPPEYRAGVAEGLLIGRSGYAQNPTPTVVSLIAKALAPHPSVFNEIEQLSGKVVSAGTSESETGDEGSIEAARAAFATAAEYLPAGQAQQAWDRLRGHYFPDLAVPG